MKFEQLLRDTRGEVSDSFFYLPVLPLISMGEWDGIVLIAYSSPRHKFFAAKPAKAESVISGLVLSANRGSEVLKRTLSNDEIAKLREWIKDGSRFAYSLGRLNGRCNVWLRDSWDNGTPTIPLIPEDIRMELLDLLPTEIFGELYDSVSGGYWSKYIAK